MFDRLEDLVIRYQEVMGELQEPDVANDPERFRKLMKEQSDLAPIVEAYQEYKNCKQNVEESLMILEEESDEEMRELAKEELNESKARIEELEQELKILLLPKDPNDDKNVIVEIRAGAGGDEAALFAAEVYRMYVHYADSRRWKTEMISLNENGIGGFKECVFMITGQGAYSRMKYESGVHRVQRVPETESGGRIHTSTITVAVMPEAEEVDVVIDEKDIRIDVMRASGNGGQCVNTTDSAVRLTHYPTGIVIYSQTEKSQLQNKEKAFRLLRSKLYDLELEKKQASEAAERRSQIGTGDRSEKIRTYNFPQGRVTDHRIKLTLHKLDSILNGDLDEVIDSLIAADQTAKLTRMIPEFKRPELEDKELIDYYFAQAPSRSCERTFANVYLWSRQYKVKYAILHNALVFRDEGDGHTYAYPVGKPEAVKAALEELMKICEDEDCEFGLYCVTPENFSQMEEWYPGQFRIEYDRDQADYIYETEKLATLAGKKLHGKRNHINKFKQLCPDWSYESLSDENVEACFQMALKWRNSNGCNDDPEKNAEMCVSLNSLRLYKELGFKGGVLRNGEKIVAFTVGEELCKDTFVVHIEKAFADVQGAYPMINQQFVEHECMDYTYVNREDDAGEEGLRKAKLSYRPAFLEEKGFVTRIGGQQ